MNPHLLYVLCMLLCGTLNAADGYRYTLGWLAPNTHTYTVSLETRPQSATYTDLNLPAWRPGRYYLQDYAAAVSHFEARDAAGRLLSWHKTDKDTWRVMHGAVEGIRISYHYYANNVDAGSSFLGEGQAYFNPINLFMYVQGRLNEAVELEVPDLPATWKVATAMRREGNTFFAASYHEFADAPTVLAAEMKQLQFELDGVPFFIHFHGDYQGDAEVDAAIVENLANICREQAAIFGGFPFEQYHFIYRLLPYELRHAVEHSTSSSYALPARVSSSVKAASSGIYGITSHEFWHVWNVKRIRPAALLPYDYSQPQYTSLHWFTEGVTDYYAQLTLVRLGLISEEAFYQRLARTIGSLENDFASQVVSPAAASFDSWLASSPYAHPHHQISYYTLGSRLGLLLDLRLRSLSQGAISLDDLFRYLDQTYAQQGLGVPENGIQLAAEQLTHTSWEQWFQDYVWGTRAVDYESLLKPFGLNLEVQEVAEGGAAMLGISRFRAHSQGILIDALHPGGDAFRDGLSENDLILQLAGEAAAGMDLNAYVNELRKGAEVELLVFSDDGIKKLSIKYRGSSTPRTYKLEVNASSDAKNEALRKAWLTASYRK